MPLKSQLHRDKLLENVSLQYKNANFIAEQVFPPLAVKKESGLIRIFTRDFRLEETARADKARSREVSHEYSFTSYQLEKHALKDYVGQSEMELNDVGDLRADTVEFLQDKINIRKEFSCASIFTSGAWSQGQSLAAAGQWTLETSTSNPITAMDTGSCTIVENAGLNPNYAIIPKRSMVAAKNHPSVAERLKYTSSEITPAMLGGLFDIPEILVPSGRYDTAARGQSESLSDLWQDIVFLGYKAPRPGLKQVSSGYMLMGTGAAGTRVHRWIDDEREQAEAIEVQQQYSFRQIASLAGYLINDVRG